ncbi:MAG: PilZ domain-containing protein [bacterium]
MAKEEEFDLIGKESGQSRGFVRTDERFQMEYQIISEAEFKKEKDNYINKRTAERDDAGSYSSEGSEQFLALGATQAQLQMFQQTIRAIRQLEAKIDELMSSAGKGESGSKMSKGMCVDLSAGGMRMLVMAKIAKGDIVKVVLPLPPLHPVVVGAMGTAVKLKDVRLASGKMAVDVALNFEAINEMDREEIVSYNFKRQREEASKAPSDS